MDESDLDNHVQRTADWLRTGINPNSNGTENEIAQGLAKLNQQIQQAQKGMGQAKPGQPGAGQDDPTRALDQVARLRGQLEAMARSREGGGSEPGKGGQNRPGQNAQRSGQQSGSPGSPGRNSQQSAGNGQRQGGSAVNQPGQRGGSGDTRPGGGTAAGTVWDNYDTGNNTPRARGQQQAAPTDASGNPADTERSFAQSMRELNQLRQTVKGDSQAEKEISELTRQMQHLDPSRFPGNPVMVEQMHREVLSSVDKLELLLQHNGAAAEARTGKPYAIPAGYRDSVAEYYRRLSKNP
jgi:hypothetical protein